MGPCSAGWSRGSGPGIDVPIALYYRPHNTCGALSCAGGPGSGEQDPGWCQSILERPAHQLMSCSIHGPLITCSVAGSSYLPTPGSPMAAMTGRFPPVLPAFQVGELLQRFTPGNQERERISGTGTDHGLAAGWGKTLRVFRNGDPGGTQRLLSRVPFFSGDGACVPVPGSPGFPGATIAATLPTVPSASRTLIPCGWNVEFVRSSRTIPRVVLPVRWSSFRITSTERPIVIADRYRGLAGGFRRSPPGPGRRPIARGTGRGQKKKDSWEAVRQYGREPRMSRYCPQPWPGSCSTRGSRPASGGAFP